MSWEDSNNGARFSTQRDRLTYHPGVAVESVLPEPMAQERDAGSTFAVFAQQEIPPFGWRDLQHRKKVGRDPNDGHT